ncbi:hypothetical protein FisN_25Lh202 [Fistulifera solaris]|uniref:Uncharacterized protein n=1 Tax=Fistulifera solaris TaxID=1519565 RepID=A0A1Z5KQZ5_FISSO|nr:hypothetical protein FisN_25Lh202 [Fistulifera solaris]|eukprot:GAX28744.1 hypothetical protein FisN_25Lh202 [Fistulifera solaris]
MKLDPLTERANFTYDLLPPSRKGTLCEHSNTECQAYDPYYRQQYLCGQSDVNDIPVSEYTNDMYLSLYYVTPERLRTNQLSVLFHPPAEGNLQNTAQESYMTNSFPDLDMIRIPGGDKELYQAPGKRICDMMVAESPVATRFVYLQYQKGQCHIRGKPLGIIGDHPDFRYNKFAIGTRKEIPLDIVYTLTFWLVIFMGCPPFENEIGLYRGKNDSLSILYADIGGSGGTECGYVAFPLSKIGRRVP